MSMQDIISLISCATSYFPLVFSAEIDYFNLFSQPDHWEDQEDFLFFIMVQS